MQLEFARAPELHRFGQQLPLRVHQHAALERYGIVVLLHGDGGLQQHRADAAGFGHEIRRGARDLQTHPQHRLVYVQTVQLRKCRNQRRVHRDDLVAEGFGRLAADAGLEARHDDKIDVHVLELVADRHVVAALVREHAWLHDNGFDLRVFCPRQGICCRVGGDHGDQRQLRDLPEEDGIQQTLKFRTVSGYQNRATDHMSAPPFQQLGSRPPVVVLLLIEQLRAPPQFLLAAGKRHGAVDHPGHALFF